MPGKPPKVCGCGKLVPGGQRCPCQRDRDAERKAKFDRKRLSSSARGYTGSWDRARAQFLRQHPFCRRCGDRASVVDHMTPHRGDQRLFWDKTNWQPLCTTCHSSAKQREERRSNPRT
ncbi:HNH endonuclease signature motif containing protein [Salipiger sp. PrR003]|uniref:HNH endonuclease signature motif containing protein n=1 Tax=Salipiger sp. PrR003 TaxID=2706776 RepID=UPI0013D953C5|nr:HNH endonuclease [Salipiger sp. PrR003]NDV52194.1 HNH endonuclease [Salipiger sp. PrR003]